MQVFEFDKSLLDRLEESKDVLKSKDELIPSSRVKAEWSYFIEVQIEPTGWQALWKVPRVICEELKIKYPTVVFGIVENVLFKELKAIFTVIAVEDDDVSIPEQHEVSLEELWPTKNQENTEINVENTADCIDKLRFFYNYIWMPWDADNDDDFDWAEKHLESRIRFCYDLKRKDMCPALAAYIRTLLIEARYIQKRREYIEIDISDDEDLNNTTADRTQINDLMRLHLRLAKIKNEIELLENPDIRPAYENFKFNGKKSVKDCVAFAIAKGHSKNAGDVAQGFIITDPSTLDTHIKNLSVAKEFIKEDQVVQMCPTLQDALDVCFPSAKIYLPPGVHCIKFLEYLNDQGMICGLVKKPNYTNPDNSLNEELTRDAIIMSQDDDSILLVFDGDFTLENLVLDCRNVRTGIVIKAGDITLRNCRIIGDGKSSARQGIIVSGGSKLTLENCMVQNFATGIILQYKSELKLMSSGIQKCRIGIELEDDVGIEFDDSKITDSLRCGIYYETKCLNNDIEKQNIISNDMHDLEKYFCERLPWNGKVSFENSKVGHVIVCNKLASSINFGLDTTIDLFKKSEPTEMNITVEDSVVFVDDSDLIEVTDMSE